VQRENRQQVNVQVCTVTKRKESKMGEKRVYAGEIWLVECYLCETRVELDASEFTVTSIDQGAQFIRKPKYICRKCNSDCNVTLKGA
jgi:hypothetical protein